jgi:hypothetical protein
MPVDVFYDELLTFLEGREARLLSWGFYDVSFRTAEVEVGIAAEAPASLRSLWESRHRLGESLAQHFGLMTDAGLLHRVEDGGDRFRTRFAEGVRLIARLRQMFRANQWATAPTLVADVKLHLKPRRYPRQDQPATACWSDLEPDAPRLALQRDLFHALARNRDGSPLAFAGFQRRTFFQIFRAYGRDPLSGSIVSAGTGAGKTKAFYVPALLRVAAEIDQTPFTKVLAIYPRNVLLADQLREAISEAEKLRPVLQAQGLRLIRIGALLGQTPWLSSFDQTYGRQSGATRWHGWDPTIGGYRIPFLRSPERPALDLVWRDVDRRAGRSVLYPADGGTTPHVEQGTLAFTRDELLREPPDILFLSAEMLNREMGNPAWERVLGLRQPPERTPRLLLLDEVHTYEGAAGAQIAWILRRWRYWARPRTLHIVGLSATLRQAPKHLSQVAGLSVERVEQFEPLENELESEAQEYNLAVKGDAGSGANLLSTTIQCGMLLTRLLTPLRRPPAPPSQALRPEDFYGSKVFGFTDNIDVINRWLSDMIDAERNRQLAVLRLHPQHRNPPVLLPQTQLRQMDAAGQIWELPRRLGHDLTRPLGLGRCSSQDPGLDADKELTIATSALEVGFDDPDVGAMLQHKSPISLASFVQRKGRAGRRRGTRPWAVVVLADYGRDRWDFQQVERLFEPQIEELRLPSANPYVLRIQACYFLLDWLGRRLGSVGRDGPFAYLRRATTPAFHQRAARVLGELLSRGPAWHDFRRQLGRCLRAPLDALGRRLSDAEIESILWEAPRPLLREVVPTLLRKLEAGWTFADPRLEAQVEDSAYRQPLPDFLPRASFADLDVSEVAIRLPGAEARDEFLTVGHAMYETCPGRVSKRFAMRPGERGYWHPFSPNLIGGEARASVHELFPDSLALGEISGLRAYQPQRASIVPRDPTVRDSSYASWEWESFFRAEGPGRTLPLPGASAWGDVFASVEAFLHQDCGSIEVTRLARGCRYEIIPDQGQPRRGRLRLVRSDDRGEVPEAVGFRQTVDGLRIRLRPEHLGSLPPLPAEVFARFLPDYYLHLLQESPLLQERAGAFRIEWLWQTSLAMLTATALRHRCTLPDAQQRLDNVRSAAADKVLRTIFRSRGIDPNGVVLVGRQQREIRGLWDDPDVRAEMARCEEVLWRDPDDAFRHWVRGRYVATLAHALRSAVASRRDDIAEDDLSADVAWEGPDEAVIYVTEQSSGGLGQVEQIWERLVQEPSQLFEGLEYALSHCPRCENTAHILGVVAHSRARRLARAFQEVRRARDMTSMEASRERLRRALRRSGFSADRAHVVSLLVRVLRPGSSVQTDTLLHGLNRMWRRVEHTLGLSVDLRVFAYHCVEHRRVRTRLRDTLRMVGPGQRSSRPQLYALVQQMLLLDCQDSCPECLDQPNKYARPFKPSRALARHFIGFGGTDLLVEDPSSDWITSVRAALRQQGALRLRVTATARLDVVARLPEIIAEEIEVDYLFLPVRLRRVDRLGTDWLITLDLKDGIHA